MNRHARILSLIIAPLPPTPPKKKTKKQQPEIYIIVLCPLYLIGHRINWLRGDDNYDSFAIHLDFILKLILMKSK